jgi:hypothetical protein
MCCNAIGLPALISSGDPATYSVDVGKRIGDGDIVNLHEDFNYHAQLYSENSHEHRTPTSAASHSLFPFLSVSGLERIKWSECSNFDSADCMTPKGLTMVEVQLADGVAIDVYNLHTDTGVTDADQKARASNLAQVRDFTRLTRP